MNIQFRNREEAGRLLGQKLAAYKGRPDVIVLGLPRGGVSVLIVGQDGRMRVGVIDIGAAHTAQMPPHVMRPRLVSC